MSFNHLISSYSWITSWHFVPEAPPGSKLLYQAIQTIHISLYIYIYEPLLCQFCCTFKGVVSYKPIHPLIPSPSIDISMIFLHTPTINQPLKLCFRRPPLIASPSPAGPGAPGAWLSSGGSLGSEPGGTRGGPAEFYCDSHVGGGPKTGVPRPQHPPFQDFPCSG